MAGVDLTGTLDVRARRRAKQASRDEDQRQLDAGEITPEESRRRNMFFGEGWTVDLSQPEANRCPS